MPIHETRKSRDMAAAFMLLAGISHVTQLWFFKLGGETIFAALFGMFYFLIALGLAGRSRFSLWTGILIPAMGSWASALRYVSAAPASLVMANVAINLVVMILCAYTLFRTRHVEMD